jgi:hypothetical protein
MSLSQLPSNIPKEERKIPKEKGEELAKRFGVVYFETSVRDVRDNCAILLIKCIEFNRRSLLVHCKNGAIFAKTKLCRQRKNGERKNIPGKV